MRNFRLTQPKAQRSGFRLKEEEQRSERAKAAGRGEGYAACDDERKAGDVILSGLLGCFVGTVYFLSEVAWKTARGHPEGISWTMLVLALLVGIILERMGAELPWRCLIWAQALLCGLAITAAELTAGCVLNLWLGWGVWDYSRLPGNVLGQICPQFAALWCLVSGPVIVLLDWMRYAVRGGERPRYTWRCST